MLYLIASGGAEFSLAGGFASNGYGAQPGNYSLAAGLVCEAVMTFMFLVVIAHVSPRCPARGEPTPPSFVRLPDGSGKLANVMGICERCGQPKRAWDLVDKVRPFWQRGN